MAKENKYTFEELDHYSSTVNKATADLENIASVLRVFISNYGLNCDELTQESEHKIKTEWKDVINVLSHVQESVENVSDFLNCSVC